MLFPISYRKQRCLATLAEDNKSPSLEVDPGHQVNAEQSSQEAKRSAGLQGRGPLQGMRSPLTE